MKRTSSFAVVILSILMIITLSNPVQASEENTCESVGLLTNVYNGQGLSCGNQGQTTYTFQATLRVEATIDGVLYYRAATAGAEGFPCSKNPYADVTHGVAFGTEWHKLEVGYFNSGYTGARTVMDTKTLLGCSYQSPILVSLGSQSQLKLTDPSNGVDFDLRNTGTPQRISWTQAGEPVGWLALDLNGDGIINNGTELFGDVSAQADPLFPDEKRNGYRALRLYDVTNDGLIRSEDAVWSSLRLWVDANHNGFSEPSELLTLEQVEIVELDLRYRTMGRKDRFGNRFRYGALVTLLNGSKRQSYDVFLQTAP
jgi:hypothetical protein